MLRIISGLFSDWPAGVLRVLDMVIFGTVARSFFQITQFYCIFKQAVACGDTEVTPDGARRTVVLKMIGI
jgi:hypothetical protein